ncbi:glycosyl transferase family protein [Candidatus Omnitrophus magneticus]|uniref:Glycosyl transferase family protein n=1 Tax=Candidatus Omnitrophus magneticus TaxID=1609969 RepID=A0A0F0CMX1_9BACT|nr:glycosyl transferase family protein [Candidatus Omnitrophus magneticus]
MKTPEKKIIKKILIARTDRLGDVVLTIPIIKFFRQKYPSCFISVLVRPYTKDIFQNNPDIDETIIYDKERLRGNIWNTIKFALFLKSKKFDACIAFNPSSRVHLIFFLAGIPIRIGYNRKWGIFLNKRFSDTKHKGLKHESEYNFDLLKQAGFDTRGADITPFIPPCESTRKIVTALLERENITDKIIAIHPGASCPSKMWPLERFAEICDRLEKEKKYKIILVGGKESIELEKP